MNRDFSFFAHPDQAVASFQKIAGGDPIFQEKLNEILPLLLTELRESPDPDMALANLERFTEAIFSRMAFFSTLKANPAVAQMVITLFGHSQFLADVLVRNPEYFDWFIDSAILKVRKSRDEMLQELDELVVLFTTKESKLNAMRRFKRREMLRIGLRDLQKEADLVATTQELSNLADVSLEMATRICEEELSAQHGKPSAAFCVIGMGKLGGCELNYSSDIDVMFVYSEEGETGGPIPLSHHEYFTKLAAQLIQVISGMTREGYIFRLDARLRPEGLAGPLVRSLDSYENYYASYGETWERLALIKARPCAGDAALGKAFLKMVQPFIYQKYTGFGALEELQKVKKRIDQQIASKGTTHRNVKLGRGGIREIEFSAQMLQLLYGGKLRELRGQGTLLTLKALQKLKFLKATEEKFLREAYIFLRHLEHKLQIMHERQLHTLPEKPEELEKLALRMGFQDQGKKKAGTQFEETYQNLTEEVHRLYQQFFKIPEEKKRTPAVKSLEWLLDEKADSKKVEEFFRPLGFLDSHKGRENLLLMARGPSYMRLSSKTQALYLEIMPQVLKFASQSADPDMALNNLERFIHAQAGRTQFYELLAEKPQLLKLLLTLGGGSQFLSDKLVAHPSLFGILTQPGALVNTKEKRVLEKELKGKLAAESDWAAKMNAARRFKSEELLRLGIRDLLGLIGLPKFFKELTELADVIVEAALYEATQIVSKEMEGAPPTPLVIIGMGKWGGAELAYSSDLDLLFVCEGDSPELAQQVATRVLDFLNRSTEEGIAFKADARLRPDGEKGPLVPHLESYREYYEKHLATWEKQSLTKARFVCGDKNLGNRFMKLRDESIYGNPLSKKEQEEIFKMRERIEKERTRGHDPKREIKLGTGGIVDIEFLTQLLQLKWSYREKSVRGPGTLETLNALRKRNYLSPNDYTLLKKGYLFLRQLENKLRIVGDLSLDRLPEDPAELEHCARRLTYHAKKEQSAAAQLIKDFEQYTHTIRKIYLHQFSLSSSSS